MSNANNDPIFLLSLLILSAIVPMHLNYIISLLITLELSTLSEHLSVNNLQYISIFVKLNVSMY